MEVQIWRTLNWHERGNPGRGEVERPTLSQKTCQAGLNGYERQRERTRESSLPHYSTTLRWKDGYFTIKRKSISKRLRRKVKKVGEKLKRMRHALVPEQGKWLPHPRILPPYPNLNTSSRAKSWVISW